MYIVCETTAVLCMAEIHFDIDIFYHTLIHRKLLRLQHSYTICLKKGCIELICNLSHQQSQEKKETRTVDKYRSLAAAKPKSANPILIFASLHIFTLNFIVLSPKILDFIL